MSSEVNDGRALQRLLDELGRLPGIGPASAQRIAYHLMVTDPEEVRRLSTAIVELRDQVHFCPICFNYATRDECEVCTDHTRDRSTICVVTEPRDVAAIEHTGSYHGLYHVLGGVISATAQVGPEQLHVKELMSRLASGEVKEVILATNTDVEGEATASYLARSFLVPMGITVSRINVGVGVGGEIKNADELSLARAIEDRRTV